jgi:hypothetical protein
MANDRHDLSSERAPHRNKTATVRGKELRTESNIWSQVPEWTRYFDMLTDWPSVVT